MKYFIVIIAICIISLLIIGFFYVQGHSDNKPVKKPYKIEAYISTGDKAEDVKLMAIEYFLTKEEAIKWAVNYDCTEAELTEVITGNHLIVKLNGKRTTTQGWDGQTDWLIEK